MNTYITTSFIKRLSSTTWLLRLRGLLLRLRLCVCVLRSSALALCQLRDINR